MKLVIVFAGLIAHMVSEDSWRVVLVETPPSSHRAEMWIHEDDVVPNTMTGFTSRKIGDYHVLNLEHSLTISNLPAGRPTKAADFDTYVPSLSDAKLTVDADAQNGVLSHSGVQASLVLGGGAISPRDCFVAHAVWTGSGKAMPNCLVRHVRYETTPTAETVTISDGKGASVTVKPSHQIEIKNHESGNHFYLYRRLEKAATGMRVPRRHPELTCVSCDKVMSFSRNDVRLFPELDCSNSQYP